LPMWKGALIFSFKVTPAALFPGLTTHRLSLDLANYSRYLKPLCTATMASTRNSSITSYFKPTHEDKGKGIATPRSDKKGNDSTTLSGGTTQISKATKQQVSTSPSGPTSKRLIIDRNSDDNMDDREQHHLSYDDLPSDWLFEFYPDIPSSWYEPPDPDTPLSERPPIRLQLTYHTGDMFKDAPKNTLLIHACNTQGHWGAGIAKVFKDKYPKAYAAHHKFCTKEHGKANPVPTGTAQLLAPVDRNFQHWIGCLFTSAKYGKAKDKPDAIVQNTGASMKMLLEFAKMSDVTNIRMCKINSGKFGVAWERTEEELKKIVLRDGWQNTIEVWEPES
jgi:ADP-ribose 1''-phosphate phosphatase